MGCEAGLCWEYYIVCLVDHSLLDIIMGYQGVGGGVQLWDIFPVLEKRRLDDHLCRVLIIMGYLFDRGEVVIMSCGVRINV